MATTVNLNREQARELVEKIAREHGHIPENTYAQMSPEVRAVVKEAMRAKDDQIASSVFTLARNLYTSNARFVFELFQNADDNQFTVAQSTGEDPSVSFLVYHDMLVVECNEDGFTEENIRAICEIGKSSKHGTQGYIGEKGIGFKSTFMAAWKVQIRSGPFSFYFQHRDGDSGIGMITPIWFEPSTESSRSMTTTTLYFHDNGNPGELKTRRDDVIKQIFELQGTALMFLQKLRRINIVLFDENRQQTMSRQTLVVRIDNGSRVELHTIESQVDLSWTTTKQYFVSSHTAQGLARNENRTYTEAEEKAQAYSNAQVGLAFPLDEKDEPIVEAQELFAFMPVRKVGFNFLIHSDFVTQANRQDIVTTSERNLGLRQAIADAFAKAVQELCTHPSLRYKWMRYLPRQNSLPLDHFWKELVASLKQALSKPSILYPRAEASERRYRITDLKRLDSKHLDKGGEPLLPDLPSAKYLSAKYSRADVEILGEYGLQYLQIEDVMERLQDFVKQPSWKLIVYQHRDEEWHSRTAKLIMQILNDKHKDWKALLKSIPLLPLNKGVLASPSAFLHFFVPDIDGVVLPEDLDINMILRAAASNQDCRNLYKILGAKKMNPDTVRDLIIKKHRSWATTGLNPAMANSHLRYLFQMHPKDRIDADDQRTVVVFDQKGRAKNPRTEIVYLPGKDDWSPGNLLKPLETPDSEEVDVSIIHPAYLRDEPKSPASYDKSWQEWLIDVVWLEDKILIMNDRDAKAEEAKEFSKEWLFIANNHSDKMVARLQLRWPRVREFWEKAAVATKLQRELRVCCLSGAKHTMEGTFVPFPSLLDHCEQILTNVNAVPFVKLSCPLEDSDAPNWVGYGKHFGIGVTDDLDFSLAVLRAIASGDSKTKDPYTQTILDLYLRIYAQCLASEDRDGAQKQVREFCIEHRAVLCSHLSSNTPREHALADADWKSPTKCLWNAPKGFTSRTPVKEIWKPIRETLGVQDRGNLDQFFRHTLLIKDLTSGDIVDELREVAELCEKDPTYSLSPEFLHEIYKMLDTLRKGMDDSSLLALKETFKEENLIYVPSDQVPSGQPKRWFNTLECVWSSEGTMLGKPCLESFYPNLAELFVDYFGVPKLNFALAYQQLVEIGSSIPTISYIKNLLWSLTVLLTADNESRPAFGDEAQLCRVFPVRMPDGIIRPLTALDNFAIIDRRHYAAALKGRIKTLDFSLDEVRRLKPLISWVGLKDRYLSRLVAERTVVEDEQCPIDGALTRDLVRKAGAFVSIATHFDSPLATLRSETLHSRLRKTRVFVAQTITSTLVFQQDEQPIVLPISNSELHIEVANSGGFDIYVPSDGDARDFCVASKLPYQLSAYLMDSKPSRVDAQMVSVITSIIHSKPTNISRVLEANGIIELELPFQNDDVMEIDGSVSEPSRGMMPGPGLPRPSTPSTSTGRVFNIGRSPLRENNGSASSPTRFQRQQNEAYRKLLDRLVEEARGLRFPHRDSTLDMGPPSQTTQSDRMLYGFWASNVAEKREMVGAAGEFFVFKFLSNLNPKLPGFNGTCWQSTARHHANAHPEYSTLEPWNGDETGKPDILYSDESRVLTQALIKSGYLDESWRNEQPEYSIEVKTTMSNNFQHPFYLSKQQYSRIQSASNVDTHSAFLKKEIYLLFRVYGLESGNVGVKIYVDPEAAHKDGLLEFEPNSWIVTPKMKPVNQMQTEMQSQAGGGAPSAPVPTWSFGASGVGRVGVRRKLQ